MLKIYQKKIKKKSKLFQKNYKKQKSKRNLNKKKSIQNLNKTNLKKVMLEMIVIVMMIIKEQKNKMINKLKLNKKMKKNK